MGPVCYLRRKLHRYRAQLRVACLILYVLAVTLFVLLVSKQDETAEVWLVFLLLALGGGVCALVLWRSNRMAKPDPPGPEEERNRPVNVAEATQLAVRAMALAARAFIEIGLHLGSENYPPETASQARGGINRMLRESGTWEFFAPEERDALSCPAGAWNTEQRARYGIEHEIAATLLWALGQSEALPDPGVIASGQLVGEYFGHMREAEKFLATAKLRDMTDLRVARDSLMLWCARGQLYLAQKDNMPAPPGQESWSAMIEQLVAQAAELGVITPLEGDFPVHDRPYRELSPAAWGERYAAVAKRYEILCWLTGVPPVWEEAQSRAAGMA